MKKPCQIDYTVGVLLYFPPSPAPCSLPIFFFFLHLLTSFSALAWVLRSSDKIGSMRACSMRIHHVIVKVYGLWELWMNYMHAPREIACYIWFSFFHSFIRSFSFCEEVRLAVSIPNIFIQFEFEQYKFMLAAFFHLLLSLFCCCHHHRCCRHWQMFKCWIGNVRREPPKTSWGKRILNSKEMGHDTKSMHTTVASRCSFLASSSK